jgi:hypothetical protein
MKLIDLITKYPNAFAHRSPNYAFERFGFECSDGWSKIIEPIADYLEKYNSSNPDKVRIAQVKEKFGGLRFYCHGGDAKLGKLIRKAEEESYSVCEECGEEASQVKVNKIWIRTLCEAHRT